MGTLAAQVIGVLNGQQMFNANSIVTRVMRGYAMPAFGDNRVRMQRV
jgi:methyl coenzyme M reductase beta subunit